MDNKRVNLLELPDYEKVRILEEAKIHLLQQVSEARLCRDYAAAIWARIDSAKA